MKVRAPGKIRRYAALATAPSRLVMRRWVLQHGRFRKNLPVLFGALAGSVVWEGDLISPTEETRKDDD